MGLGKPGTAFLCVCGVAINRHYLKLEGSVSIGVHAEHTGGVDSRQALNVTHAGLKGGIGCRDGVPLSRGKACCQRCGGVAAREQLGEQHSVVVICHSASIVDLACHILKSCPGNGILPRHNKDKLSKAVSIALLLSLAIFLLCLCVVIHLDTCSGLLMC